MKVKNVSFLRNIEDEKVVVKVLERDIIFLSNVKDILQTLF